MGDGVGVALGDVECGLNDLGLDGAAGGDAVAGDLVLEVAVVPGGNEGDTDAAPGGGGADVHAVVPAETVEGAVGGGDAVAGLAAGALVSVVSGEVKVGVQLEQVAVGGGVGTVQVVQLLGDVGRGGGGGGGGGGRRGGGHSVGLDGGRGDGAGGDVEARAVCRDDGRSETSENRRCRDGGDGRDRSDGRDGDGDSGGLDADSGDSEGDGNVTLLGVGVLRGTGRGADRESGGAGHSACGNSSDSLRSGRGDGGGHNGDAQELGAEGGGLGLLLESANDDGLGKAVSGLDETTLLKHRGGSRCSQDGGGEKSDWGDLGEHF